MKKLKPEMLREAILANNHRYKAEPLLSKTAVGSLWSATTEELAKEDALSLAIIEKLMGKSGSDGEKAGKRS